MSMSYSDVYQRPGTLIRMLSWYNAPLYHAGSLGSRWIILPPPGTGIESAKIPFGPPTDLMMSCNGRCQYALFQSTGGRCAARSQAFDSRIRSSWDVFGGNIGCCGF